MKISILTLFPESFQGFLNTSIMKRALTKKAIEIELINIRDFTTDKYGRVDSAPVGGGAGLIMKIQPIVDALKSIKTPSSYTILLSPRGGTFTQKIAHHYSRHYEHLIIICGHYEGIDERVSNYVDELVSLGDFILTGGELVAMVITDAITRLQEGAISGESILEESFENGLLEYPQFTEPYAYDGHTVPDILFSGNHQAIKKWRHKKELELTKTYRPDLFAKYPLSKKDKELLNDTECRFEKEALEKGKKFLKK